MAIALHTCISMRSSENRILTNFYELQMQISIMPQYSIVVPPHFILKFFNINYNMFSDTILKKYGWYFYSLSNCDL